MSSGQAGSTLMSLPDIPVYSYCDGSTTDYFYCQEKPQTSFPSTAELGLQSTKLQRRSARIGKATMPCVTGPSRLICVSSSVWI